MGVTAGLLTLLFTDIEGGIRLWEDDRDAMAVASARNDRIVREQIEASGGHVFKAVGEAHRAVFADPVAALSSAVAIQRAVSAEPWASGLPARVCMALHSGACAERDGDYVGPVVNRTARLLGIGHGGQILVTAAAYQLLAGRLPGGIGLRDLGEQRLRDLGRAERVFQVTGPGLAEGFGTLRSLDDPALRHNLPSQSTSFVGRTAELAELRALVSGGSRLVTITGPGGIGKSRLALQAAVGAVDGAGGGVWLVELAPVAEPELVARTAAAALGVREGPGRPVLEALAGAIGDRDLLLVLDNAEHVLGAVAELAGAVIRSCPRACLLVTSREPLGISGEHVFRVPGLTVPPAGLAAPGRLAAFESVQLFAEHAALHQRSFAVDDASAAAVASICVRLDGIPLALELAAARLGSLSVSEVSARLDQRFRLLTTGNRTALPRHRTLRALIDWSYDLLSPEERIVFGRLSVFAGGWSLEAAEAVAHGGDVAEWQVLDLLAALVGKSLVQTEVIHGSTRYRLLETVRHYAAERLTLRAGSELRDVRIAHRDHYLAFVETAAARLRGPDEAVWLDRLEAEFDNIRAALAFSIADPDSAEPGLRLAAGLRWFCIMRSHGGEVLKALDVLLKLPDARTSTRARALTASCHLLIQFGDDTAVPSMAREAIEIARVLADEAVAADARAHLCWFMFEHGDLPNARAQVDEAVQLARTTAEPRLVTWLLHHRAVFNGEGGDLESSFADHAEALALSRATGDNYLFATTLGNLGIYEQMAGKLEAARSHLHEARALAENRGYPSLSAGFQQALGFASLAYADPHSARRHFISSLAGARITGVRFHVNGALLGLAIAAGADGDPTVAATLHGFVDEQYEQDGRGVAALEGGLRDRARARLRLTLGDATFEAAYRHGRTLSPSDGTALATAAAELDPEATSTVTVRAAGPLSERERQIMALLAGGAGNAKIAETLFVTPNTVRTHLDRIRDKTGARNRADLTRYAIQAGIKPVAPSL